MIWGWVAGPPPNGMGPRRSVGCRPPPQWDTPNFPGFPRFSLILLGFPLVLLGFPLVFLGFPAPGRPAAHVPQGGGGPAPRARRSTGGAAGRPAGRHAPQGGGGGKARKTKGKQWEHKEKPKENHRNIKKQQRKTMQNHWKKETPRTLPQGGGGAPPKTKNNS